MKICDRKFGTELTDFTQTNGNGNGSTATPTAVSRPDFPVSLTQLYINGEWRDSASGKTFAAIDPTTEEEIAQLAEGTVADVEAAVKAANEAFESGPWSQLSGHERGEILWRVGDLFHKYGEELAFLQAKEMGRLFCDSMTVDIPHLANMFHYYAGWASKIEGAVKQTTKGLLTYTLRAPLGVVAAITPFNFPLILSISKFAPALAAGNTIIHKPASATPLAALKVAQIMEEAGVPPGVFNVVMGPGGTVGNALSTHPGIEKVAITGSTASGIRVIKDSADTLKHLTMELGGKSANIIFADADLETATQSAYDGMFYNKGEICYAGSRMLVERAVYDEVIDRVRQRALSTKPGDPLDPSSDMGPIANKSEYDKALKYMAVGKQENARLVAGGKAADIGTGKGYFVEPTVFADTTEEMTIVREETFGPILSIIPFEGFDEAIRIANGNQYGLASGVHSRDIKKAHKAAAALKAGTVCNNPILPVSVAGELVEENHTAWGVPNAAEIVYTLRQAGFPVAMAWSPFESANHWYAIAMERNWRQQMPDIGAMELCQKLGDVLFQTKAGMGTPKYIVVNDDIDLTNTKEVVWAFATRNYPGSKGEIVFNDASTNPLVAFLTKDEKMSMHTTKVIYNCLPPDDWGDQLPQRSSFAGTYPAALQASTSKLAGIWVSLVALSWMSFVPRTIML